jgi:3',5'-cyclic AMP phosphodiesterase CpdA
MRPYKYIIIFFLTFSGTHAFSQDVSFIALGDMHYDRLDDHDLDYVMTRPQDFQQIFNEYPQLTAFYMTKFLHLVKKQTIAITPNVKAVVQLGDLVQGVAGTPALARQMDRGVVDLLHSIELPVPWILTKGNHDVSNSPGQPEAWEEVIRPFIEGQIKKPANHGMYTFSLNDNVDFFVLDQFFSNDRNVPESEMVSFLETELAKSKAKYKFVMTHQPVIPVTERSWHLLSGIRRPLKDSDLRNKFLNLLGKYQVIVLSAHLHKYSVLSRATPSGNIVQVMVNSVNRSLELPEARDLMSSFTGAQMVDDNPSWQPSNSALRRKILEEEKQHIKSFRRADLPGYAVISITDTKNEVMLHYYNGFSEKPYESVNLTALQK